MNRKYYVTSGELKQIVLAKDPKEAAEKALDLASGQTIDPYFIFIDERGFRTEDAEHKLQTDDLIATFGVDEGEE